MACTAYETGGRATNQTQESAAGHYIPIVRHVVDVVEIHPVVEGSDVIGACRENWEIEREWVDDTAEVVLKRARVWLGLAVVQRTRQRPHAVPEL